MTNAEYFAWLDTQTDPKVIIKELLDNWHMFCGDGYYHEFHVKFEEKLERIVEGSL